MISSLPKMKPNSNSDGLSSPDRLSGGGMNIIKVRWVFLIVFLSLALFLGGYFLGTNGYRVTLSGVSNKSNITITREVPSNLQDINFSLFWKVWDLMSSNYYDKSKIDPVKMVYGAIAGMVDAIGDPYTSFLPPTQNKVVEEDLGGSFEGVGIQIGFKGTQLAVEAPLPGSPAEAAGIKAGDYIIGIKDESKDIERGTVGINLSEAVQIIRGPAGTKVNLTLLREGEDEPRSVDVVRQKIDVPSVTVKYLDDDKVAHVRILKFGAETKAEWEKITREVIGKSSVQGIVLDLRNNPGGYLDAAVDIAGEFLPNGSVAVIEERGTGEKTEFKVKRFGLFTKRSVVVLVNGGSASASEILSGAMRDVNKTKLVGEKTFGKGTIQEPRQLEGGSGVHITIAKWLTPNGTWVHEKGLEPDVQVEDNQDTEEDEQLLKAQEIVLQK